MTSGPDFGRYDPFEDTGDWPFRDAPPKREDDDADERAPVAEPDPPALVEDTELSAAIEADEEALESEPAIEEMLPTPVEGEAIAEERPAALAEPIPAVEEVAEADGVIEELEDEQDEVADVADVQAPPAAVEHAPGTLVVPPGVDTLTGGPHGFRRSVAVVVSRFNGDITTSMLEGALAALRDCNVGDDAVTVVPVPGAFELPITALALAKTRRFSCIVALGCIIRGETPHFDLIASEAASGLQLAAIETGIPVAFGVITTETREQAEARVDRGAEAARTALEMADLFSHVRTRTAAAS
jgi:6,7-dimethyl-8-ribityllumazine synthase